jgi:hypothetical protein
MKQAIITIPIEASQRSTYDSLVAAYQEKTPYDYAFLGMRCGAAAYDVLAHSGVLPLNGRAAVARKIFYPKKLRKKLLWMAERRNWTVVVKEGSGRRKWEKD